MLDKNTEKTNLNWEDVKNNNKEGSDIFYDTIESINEAELETDEDKKIAHIEKALYNLRHIDFNKYKNETDIILSKLRDESLKVNQEELLWWDKFFINKSSDIKIRKILGLIEKADNTGKEEDITKAVNLVEKLNPVVYEYDINIIERKLKVLEKRVDRQVSDGFGSILASLRMKKGLSLAKLGALAGVSASYINRIELNQRKAPSYPIIEKLAIALEVNINTLLVAAGANLEESETKSLREIVFSTNVSIGESGKALNLEKKEQLVQIVDFISNMDWKSNKHLESLELFNLIDEYKK